MTANQTQEIKQDFILLWIEPGLRARCNSFLHLLDRNKWKVN